MFGTLNQLKYGEDLTEEEFTLRDSNAHLKNQTIQQLNSQRSFQQNKPKRKLTLNDWEKKPASKLKSGFGVAKVGGGIQKNKTGFQLKHKVILQTQNSDGSSGDESDSKNQLNSASNYNKMRFGNLCTRKPDELSFIIRQRSGSNDLNGYQ